MEALLRVLDGGDAILMRRAHKAWNQCRERLESAATGADQPAPDEPAWLGGDAANGSHAHALRQFMRAFSARDIAEPIASFDTDTAALKAREIMESNGWIVAGLRRAGRIDGYVRCEDLVSGVCGDHHRTFSRGQIVTADASLSEVIFVLTRYTGCYVDMIGDVAGVILREHVQKPIVRMWLFGMITIIEMSVTQRLAEVYPDEQWRELITPGRLQKAETLRDERSRRGTPQKLVDCLQLSDKIQILIKDDAQLAWMGFDSRRVAKGVAKEFESLRNNLAHAQDIVATDWPQIARMTQRIEVLLGGIDE